MANCTKCQVELKEGEIGYTLQKGTFDPQLDDFVYEHEAGTYHEACFPNTVPMNPEEPEEEEDEDSDTNG